MPANWGASLSSRRISRTSARSSSRRRPGAGTRTGARRTALAARDPPVRRAALSRRRDQRGHLDGVEAFAGRRRGRRSVDDADAVRRRQDRLRRLVLDVARHLRGARVRLERAHALRDRLRHVGHAGRSCTRPRRSTSSAARTATASARRSRCRRATCSAPSSRCSPRAARTGKPCELTRAQRQRRGRGGLRRAASIERKGRP